MRLFERPSATAARSRAAPACSICPTTATGCICPPPSGAGSSTIGRSTSSRSAKPWRRCCGSRARRRRRAAGVAPGGLYPAQLRPQRAGEPRARAAARPTRGMFPEISAGQHRFTIRFVRWRGVDARPAQVSQDVALLSSRSSAESAGTSTARALTRPAARAVCSRTDYASRSPAAVDLRVTYGDRAPWTPRCRSASARSALDDRPIGLEQRQLAALGDRDPAQRLPLARRHLRRDSAARARRRAARACRDSRARARARLASSTSMPSSSSSSRASAASVFAGRALAAGKLP